MYFNNIQRAQQCLFSPAVPWSLKIGVEKTGLGFSRKRKATGELQGLGEVMNYG